MGGKQSKVSSFQYHRLSPCNSPTKPFLIDNEDHEELEGDQEKIAALHRAFVDIKSGFSRLQSKISQIESRPPLIGKEDAETNELKLRVAKLESSPPEKDRLELVEREMKELNQRVVKLENMFWWKKKQEDGIEKIEKKMEELINGNDNGLNLVLVLVFLVSVLIGLNL